MIANCRRKKAAVSGYISARKGTFLLAGAGYEPSVYVDERDYEGVRRAAEDLCEDMEAVTGSRPEIGHTKEDADIVIGTLGRNAVIDSLAAQGKLDVSGLAGRWECFQISLIEHELVIAGSDKRGTIFGIYDLCEKAGVSPWKWWADVRPGYAENLFINLDAPFVWGEPSVKYRGIFINDEYAFDNWALNRGDADFVETYERIYELLLRLKANLLWPAMHDGSPYFHKNPLNAANADGYGIIIGTSHCEMLLRNNVSEYFAFERQWEQENPHKALYKKKLSDSAVPCAYVYTDIDPDTKAAVSNKEMLCEYWKESIAEYGRYECIFTMGMRGLHDAAWQPVCGDTEDAGQLLAQKRDMLEEIIRMQRELLQEVLGELAEKIPQLFIPYKEIQEIYDSGMELPEDMMLMWTDDNYGYIRQLPTDDTRSRDGGAGIYYHVGYHGSPNSYIWLSTTPYALIREEMGKAYDYGAGKIWMLNVGDLKPAEGRIEYFLELAGDMESVRSMDLADYIAGKARRDFDFDAAAAREYASVELGFQTKVYARKPEHYELDLFSCISYGDEAGRYLEEYEELTRRSEALYDMLGEEDKPAFYQMQLYPLRSCRNMAAKYINVDRAACYADRQGGSSVSWYGMLSDAAYFALLEDTKAYNMISDGKWNLIMDPYQPYFRSRKAVLSALLPKPACGLLGYSRLGVYPEDSMLFHGTVQNERYVDICNEGTGYVDWKICSNRDWVRFSKTEGVVFCDERVIIRIDWGKVPKAKEEAEVTVSGMEEDKEWHSYSFTVTVDNRKRGICAGTFVEMDGYISIEAAHFTEQEDKGVARWRTEKHLGRYGNALKLYPNLLPSVEEPDRERSAYVSYPLWFDSAGEFEMEVYRIPTLNERGRIRFAIGLDSQKPCILEGTRAYVNDSDGTDSWGKGVYENTEILTGRIDVQMPGFHMLRIYQVDAGVVLDKIVIYTMEKKKTYFGPQESRAAL